MSEEKKFLDYEGVKYLWSKINMQDYPNNQTLIDVINAIDETKADKNDLDDYVKNSELFNEDNIIKQNVLPDGYPYASYDTILPETTLEVDVDSQQAVVIDRFILAAELSYDVTYNGTTYSCVSQVLEIDGIQTVVLGNAAPLGGEESEEPFAIVNFDDSMAQALGAYGFIFATDGSETITISISGMQIQKMSSAFMPALDVVTNIVNGSNIGSVRSLSAAKDDGEYTIGTFATAFGYGTKASGAYAYAEGDNTTASGDYSHVEGSVATASGQAAHAEGSGATASGTCAHAEGLSTTASGVDSHAEGLGTTASGGCSHAEGYFTIANGPRSHVQGKYNIEDTNNRYAHIVGNGNDINRSNAHTLDWDGNAWYAGDIRVGGTSYEDGSEVALKSDISSIVVPTKVSELANDKGYLMSYTETDPTVPSWAKQSTKPTYIASEVGADASGTASAVVSTHNSSAIAHADIREDVEKLLSLTEEVGVICRTNNLNPGGYEYGTFSSSTGKEASLNPVSMSLRHADYVPVEGGKAIAIFFVSAAWNSNNAGGMTMKLVEYDSDKNIVAVTGARNYIVTNRPTYTLNANTEYVRIGIDNYTDNTAIGNFPLDDVEIAIYYAENAVTEFVPYEISDTTTMIRGDMVSSGGYLNGKKIVYDGDSICMGYNARGGYPALIASATGGSYDNQAVGGARLCANSTQHSVVNNISNLPKDGDLYCFQGGINDWWANTPLGTFTQGDYTGAVDPATIYGAMETIFRYALTNFVGKPICFVITHKIQNNAYSKNTNGCTFWDYRKAMIDVCEKYSIPYYDAFTESGLNGWNEIQNNAYLTGNNAGTADGIHPNAEGYKRYYVPQLLNLFRKIMPV